MNNSKSPTYLEVPLVGKNLLEASAGTGKTFTVALLYLRALLGLGTPENKPLTVEEILVVTFTNAATEELIGRIRERIKDALQYIDRPEINKNLNNDEDLNKVLAAAYLPGSVGKKQCKVLLKTALSEFSFAHISTIHSFCVEICNTVSLDSGLPLSITLSTDSEHIDQPITDLWRENIYLDDESYNTIVGKYSVHTKIYKKFLNKQIAQLQTPESSVLEERFLNFLPERKILEDHFKKYRSLYIGVYKKTETLVGHLDGLYKCRQSKKIPKKHLNYFSAHKLLDEKVFKAISKKEEQARIDADLKKELVSDVEKNEFFSFLNAFQNANKRDISLVDYSLFYKSFKSLDNRLTHQENSSTRIFSDRLIQIAADVSEDKRIAELIRNKLPLAIIDEFQDTDPFQYRLFKNIYSGEDCGLLMVGDPKQAIYSFRGGDVYTYLKAKGDVINTYDLKDNYRSADKVVRGINAIFSQLGFDNHPHHTEGAFNQKNIGFVKITAKARKPLLQVESDGEFKPLCAIHAEYLADNSECQLDTLSRRRVVTKNCAEYVHKLLSLSSEDKCFVNEKVKGSDTRQQPLKHSDIALLVNSHTEAMLLKRCLQDKGIPSLTNTQNSIYKEQEAYDCWLILRAILEPTNHRYFESALLATVNGLSYQQVYARIHDDIKLQEWVEELHKLHENIQKQGPLVAINGWFNMVDADQSFIHAENDRRATNVLQILELLQDDFVLFGGGQKMLTRFERAIANEDNSDESLLRLESDEDRVKIVTIHSSKGLEYPVVIVPFAWSQPGQLRDVLYSTHDEQGNALYGFSDQVKNAQQQEIKDEKLRLFYVALTRATQHLKLYFIDSHIPRTHQLSNAYNKSPLGWYFPTANDTESVKTAYSNFVKSLEAVNKGCVSLDDCEISQETNDKQLVSLKKIGKKLNTKIQKYMYRGTSSFSMITKGYSVALKDADEEDSKDSSQQVLMAPEGRHALAKGAHIGTALHNVLEYTDFTRWAGDADDDSREVLDDLVQRELKANGVIVDNKKLELVLHEYSQWIVEVINTPFLNIENNDSVALKDLKNWYPELEFTFPLDHGFSRGGLRDLLEGLGYNLSGLSGSSISGMLTGSIDLVFNHNGKYYLADYKSNHLGNNYSAYTPEKLAISNDKKAYTLQYLIYTVALDKHLSKRISDYDYEKHFGGVFYLYLRGMHPEQGDKGIFFEKPGKSAIEVLSAYLSNNKQTGTASLENEVAP